MTTSNRGFERVQGLPDLLSATLSSDQVQATAGNDVLHGLDDELEYYWDFRQGKWLSRIRLNPITSSADHLNGGDGDDVISSWSGNDVVLGGAGHDWILAGKGMDLVAGEEGNDRIFGAEGNDILLGGAGDDLIYGGADHDYLDGGEGDDLLDGQAGEDTAYFVTGHDIRVDLRRRSAQATGEGLDRLLNIENVSVSSGNDVVIGSNAANRLDGGAGHDRLEGGRGDDVLLGGDGHDCLNGGAGNDRLYGGSGLDLAEYLNRSKTDFHAYRTGDQELTLISDLRGRETDVLTDVEVLSFRDGSAGFGGHTYRNIDGFSVLDWSANGSVQMDTDSRNDRQGLWGRNSRAQMSLHKFVGLAEDGFDVYDTGAGGRNQPGMMHWADDVTLFHKSLDLGITSISGGAGYAYDVGLKAGVRVDLDASTGSLIANLDDRVTFDWTRNGDTVHIGSHYQNLNSVLSASTPFVSLNLEGLFQSQASFKLKGDIPLDGKGWRYSGDLLPGVLDQNVSFFDLGFDSRESSREIPLLGNALTTQFLGLNLDTDRSFILDGVMHSVAEDDLFNVNLDVDAAVGMFFGLPNGLTLDVDWSVVSANFTLADLDVTLTASARQEMTAKVDSVTGQLLMENGQRLNYTVGQELDLSLATYDTNGDGLIQFSTLLNKQATIANDTDILLTASADFSAIAGGLRANLGDLGSIGDSFGPVINPEPWNLGRMTFDAYNTHWSATIGSINQQVAIG